MAASNSSSSKWQEYKPRAYEALKNTFGFEAFRGVQEDAVKAALEGRDSFVLMPTGGGKSLCYALPAVVKGGLVLVVSPLIALMQDQVSALQALGVAADYLSSTLTASQRKAVMARMTGEHGGRPQLALLYVTPELLATDSFRQRLSSLHAAKGLQMLAIDEAHCISQWGHDFRPSYRQLAQLRAQLKGLPCMALTATATGQVQQDILMSLRMHNPVKLITSFNRPNIHYTVVLLDVQSAPSMSSSDAISTSSSRAIKSGGCNIPATTGADQYSSFTCSSFTDADDEADLSDADLAGYSHLLQLLRPSGKTNKRLKGHSPTDKQRGQHNDGTEAKAWSGPVAIVYALKRSTVDVVVRRLAAEGLAVAGYHAALSDAVRADVLDKWRAGKLQVVVATVAFGMGVDKADIELVVHLNLPRTVEAFYQESGRAGRGGQPARSVLFYSTRDRRRMDYILQKDADTKSVRKHKKAAQAAAAAAAQQHSRQPLTAATATQNPSGTTDPVAAAAALRAFGCIVELCTQPGCRRVRLLKHFGEEYTPQQQQHAGSSLRCCDYCDNASSVEAAIQQLSDTEAAMLQRWRGYRGLLGSNKRQKRGEGGVFDDAAGCSGSEDGDDAVDSDYEFEVGPEALAAAAAVAKAAAASKGAGTNAFLTAMMRAEQRHEQQQIAATGVVESDPLQRLLAAKESSADVKKPAGMLTDDLRASRRSKLADLVSSNANLVGCTPEAAVDIASALEAIAALPGTTAALHGAEMRKLAAGVKAAQGWLDLPTLHQLSGTGLIVVLKCGVEALMRAVKRRHQASKVTQQASVGKPAISNVGGRGAEAQRGSDVVPSVAAIEKMLLSLAKVPVTSAALEATGVAKQIKALRKHPDQSVAAAAEAAIEAWRSMIAS